MGTKQEVNAFMPKIHMTKMCLCVHTLPDNIKNRIYIFHPIRQIPAKIKKCLFEADFTLGSGINKDREPV